MGADLPYGNCAQQSMLIGKRPASSLNVSPIPTKRVHTGSRQRILSPFSSAAAAGGLQVPTKTDASSGDTNSFQDDQSTLQGGFQSQKNMDVESFGDFERQLPYDSAETPTKPKKKKKAKSLKCDQFSAEFYRIESVPRAVPVLCNSSISTNSSQSQVSKIDLCSEVCEKRHNVSITSSPFALQGKCGILINSTSKLTDLWQSKGVFIILLIIVYCGFK